MSTFDGRVKEFPSIRIDYFRASASDTSSPPLAYFLSHVHSDHLYGLESCKSPFIYCSPATREILLRLEKYPHRMNFARGILESRKQTYRHLDKLLKPIPLETPTVLELAPGKSVRVTLFDANHCVGAVMFLIEGDGRAVLYTGDVRAEPWWIESLRRQPLLLPYTSHSRSAREPLRRLDCIYLDTTLCDKADPYQNFASKAEGLGELIEKLAKYPPDTLFYFDAWTFGYEDVWQTVAAFLDTPVHVDEYRFGLYMAMAKGSNAKTSEASRLLGYHCGNHFKPGCLTNRQTRLHSCEKGTGCEIWTKDFVRITPIITRYEGKDVVELGAGGGQGDLDQHHELELGDPAILGQLIALCASNLQGRPDQLSGVLKLLTKFMDEQVEAIVLDSEMLNGDRADGVENGDDFVNVDEIPIDRLIPRLTRLVEQNLAQPDPPVTSSCADLMNVRAAGLPKQITFPYSRHSSYSELCHLVEAFLPKDIYPCTVDYKNWAASDSMSFMFGHLYEGAMCFEHDQRMFKKASLAAEGRQSRPSSASSLANRKGDVEVRQSLKRKAGPHSSSKLRRDEEEASGEGHADQSRKRAHVGLASATDNEQYVADGYAHRSSNGALANCVRSKEVEHASLAKHERISVPMSSPSGLANTMIVGPTAQRPTATTSPSQHHDQHREGLALPDVAQARNDCDVQGSGGSPSAGAAERPTARAETMAQPLDMGTAKVLAGSECEDVPSSAASAPSRLAMRREAWEAVLDEDYGGTRWYDIGLVSVRSSSKQEEEL